MKRIFYYVLISISMLIFSCRTDSDLGLGILPEDDLLNAEIIDTFSIEVYTASSDTIVTSGTSVFMLGEYTDPLFGRSRASFLTQFGLSEYPSQSDLTGYSADSAILVLGLDTALVEFYGNLNSNQNISIYQISNNLPLYVDSSYYSNEDPSQYKGGTLVADMIFLPDQYADSLVIKFSQSFADQFINNDIYESDEVFRDFFNGLYVESECDDDNGAVIKYYANSSYIRLYYSNDNENDSINFIPDGSSSLRFNLFEHDYTGAPFVNRIDLEEEQDSVAYIQSLAGVTAKIYIPFLENLSSLNDFAIYRAELVIKTAPSEYTFENDYAALPEIALTGYDPEAEYYLLPEYLAGSTYYGESYAEGEYRFDIGAYIREIIDGETANSGLWLFAPPGKSFFERSIITSGNHSDAIKLYVTLQKL